MAANLSPILRAKEGLPGCGSTEEMKIAELCAHEDCPTGSTTYRVLRGGSFDNYAGYVRCAYCGRAAPTSGFANFGFRLCVGVVR
jgi:formylglycine-generating enzyme required for sulfatase activity